MSWERFLAVAWKELMQLRRDRMAVLMLTSFPIVQLLVFGYAISTDTRNIPTVVVDDDRSAASRDLVRGLLVTGVFTLRGYLSSMRDVESVLRRGDAQVALLIAPGYQVDLFRRRPARVQLILDGSDPQIVSSVMTAANGLFAARAQALTLRRLAPNGQEQATPLIAGTSVWYNPELRSAVFLVPGLIGMLLSITMIMMTSMTLARERERGTLEQLIVSPVTPLELIAGKIVPYVAIGYAQMTLILLVGAWIFAVQIIGSLLLLYALALVFIGANLAVGMVISSLVQTQQQAMLLTICLLLPNFLLSGFMFPFTAMPALARWLGECLPLTHFLLIARAIILRGSGIRDIGGSLLAMVIILIVLVVAATLRFRKNLG